MANVTGNTLTGSLSTETPITGNITVGTVNITTGVGDGYTKEEVDTLLEGKAEKNHDHDITWNGGETVCLQVAFDYAASAINNSATKQYVDSSINTAINVALGTIESELDEIIGEEV